MSDRERIAAWIGDWLADGGRLLLMMDYDGTLSPIVADPAEAWLPAAVRADLRRLADCSEVRLSVISGRDLGDLRRRIGVPEAIYAGCHGLEINGPDVAFSHPEAEAQRDSLRAIGLTLRQRAPTVAGMRVETKRLAVAVHYRDVAPEQRGLVEIELARALLPSGRRLKVFHGNQVIEVLPQVGWNKGQCALWIRDMLRGAAARPLLTLYMGDDWTDEHAFEALAGQAITIRVGPGAPATRADYRFADVTSAQAFIATLAAGLEGRGAA